MPKLTRIYTRTGDDGSTGLVGGQRVRKDHPRIAAFGELDECSSTIGAARAELRALVAANGPATARAARLDAWLAWTQDMLFNLGSDLATLAADRWENMPRATPADVAALERGIDEAQADLAPLDNFIHPGGCRAGALLHIARTIARRAERRLVALRQSDEIEAEPVRWVNRLSDALFVWARFINAATGESETLWNARTAPPEPAAA